MFNKTETGVKIIRDIQISFSHLKNSYSSEATTSAIIIFIFELKNCAIQKILSNIEHNIRI